MQAPTHSPTQSSSQALVEQLKHTLKSRCQLVEGWHQIGPRWPCSQTHKQSLCSHFYSGTDTCAGLWNIRFDTEPRLSQAGQPRKHLGVWGGFAFTRLFQPIVLTLSFLSKLSFRPFFSISFQMPTWPSLQGSYYLSSDPSPLCFQLSLPRLGEKQDGNSCKNRVAS